MSRLGKKPIALPEKVKASIQGTHVKLEGPVGVLDLHLPTGLQAQMDGNKVLLNRLGDDRALKSNHGLFWALISNMVKGVHVGFEKELEITGVGYRAELKGSELQLALGFSHPVSYPVPSDVKVSVDKQTKIKIRGADRQKVGQVAAEVCSFRPVEPYKGKGVRDTSRPVRRKAGKSAAGGKAGK